MKIGVWVYTTATTLSALASLLLSGLFQNIVLHTFGRKPMPGLTALFLNLHGWLLLPAVPFLATACWLTFRSSITVDRAFAFASLATLTIVSQLVLTIIAFILPYITIIVSMR